MTTPLLAPAPGFDQPLAVLKHCHGRIRKQLTTLQKLQHHLPHAGADVEAQQAAYAVLRYFKEAAPLHHQDEEEDLWPLLEKAASGDDAAALTTALETLEYEHRQMEAAWSALEPLLMAVAGGEAVLLPAEDVERFAVLYDAHMALEETLIAPLAMRALTGAQLSELGEAMRARRGVA